MNRTLKTLAWALILIMAGSIAFWMYLNRDLQVEIHPAELICLNIEDGDFTSFDTLPSHIYGIGLAYANHINETAAGFDPNIDPPVFKKDIQSITTDGSQVKNPSHSELINAVETIENGIGTQIEKIKKSLPALLDYEVELAFVLLSDISASDLQNEDFIPKLGYFITNDLSSRSLAILGEGQENRYDYWGISKSFEGFTPRSDSVWIPNLFQANSIPCIQIKTIVNEEERQNQNTSDLIYTPKQMLQAINRKYPQTPLKKGDWILTGTPGGVVFSAPRWLVRLAGMIGMDRFQKLEHSTSEEDVKKFLKAGDVVTTIGEGLGEVTVEIISE